MSNLIEKLKLGVENVKLIQWPGTDQKVLLKVLSQKEIQDASFAAERLFNTEKIAVNMMTTDAYETEKVIQLLYRAIRDPEKQEEPIAPSITEFRKALTKEDVEYLSEEYGTFTKDCSPNPDNISSEEFDKILVDVKKNPLSITGVNYSSTTLKKFITSLASQPVTLPMDK